MLSLPRAWVQSLVSELRFHNPQAVPLGKKKKDSLTLDMLSLRGLSDSWVGERSHRNWTYRHGIQGRGPGWNFKSGSCYLIGLI